jgi:hypothetical protein
MRERIVATIVAGLTMAVSVSLSGQSAKSASGWTVPRTTDGRPDMQGVWANNTATPLERPKQFGTRATLTDAEFTRLKQRAKALMDGGDAFFADELFNAALEGKEKFTSGDTQTGNYDQTWLSDRIFDNRTSLIFDPPDGRMPAMIPAALERQRAEAAARATKGPADRAQDLSLGTRCVSFGTPNLRSGYQSYFEITQGPDVLALRSEMIHDARVFPIGAGSHVSNAITQYHGDSRAHWDGDTLVVDTTNFVKDATRFTNSEKLRLTEKFRRVAEDTVEYYLTVDDPLTWATPWTLMIPLKKTGEGIFEFACHEGNYGLAAILRGARAEEKGTR